GSLGPLRQFLRRYSLPRPPLRGGFLADGSPLLGLHLPQVTVRWKGRELLLDDVLGYRFALLARADALTRRDTDWAAAREISVWRPGVDFLERDGELWRWMRQERLDFLLLRPD